MNVHVVKSLAFQFVRLRVTFDCLTAMSNFRVVPKQILSFAVSSSAVYSVRSILDSKFPQLLQKFPSKALRSLIQDAIQTNGASDSPLGQLLFFRHVVDVNEQNISKIKFSSNCTQSTSKKLSADFHFFLSTPTLGDITDAPREPQSFAKINWVEFWKKLFLSKTRHLMKW